MSEIVTAEAWLFGILSSDLPLRALVSGVSSYPAPRETQLPYVVYQFTSGQDVRGTGPVRIGVSGEWLIRVIAETSSSAGDLQRAADRVDSLLHAASGQSIWACIRLRPFQLIESISGRQIRHLGGFYRIWVS